MEGEVDIIPKGPKSPLFTTYGHEWDLCRWHINSV